MLRLGRVWAPSYLGRDAVVADTEVIHHGGQGVGFLAKVAAAGGGLFDHYGILLRNLIHLVYCRVNFATPTDLFFS